MRAADRTEVIDAARRESPWASADTQLMLRITSRSRYQFLCSAEHKNCGKRGAFSKGLRESRSDFRSPGSFHSAAALTYASRSLQFSSKRTGLM